MQRARLIAQLASRAARKCGSASSSQSRVGLVGSIRVERELGTADSTYATFNNLQSHGYHATCQPAGSALLETEPITDGILFPREKPGLSYALNWSLAAAGVTPSGDAFRNLKPAKLKDLGASTPGTKSGAQVYLKGGPKLSKAQFNKLFKEVTTYLSGAEQLYVHDGAVGSSPSSDARTRSISDTPGGALALSSILTPAPTRSVSAESFPLTVYVAANHSSSLLDKDGFVAVDPDASAVIVVGSALADAEAIKKALTSAAGPLNFALGALPLPGRLAVFGDSSVLIAAPPTLETLLSSAVSSSSVSPDPGVVWDGKGVARLFQTKSTEPNVYKAPNSFVLLTSDSTGAVPGIFKLSPGQAAYYYLAGYDGESFQPALGSGVDPLSASQKLAEMLTSGSVPAFMVNTNGLSEGELKSLLEATLDEKLPKGKTKPPAEGAVSSLRAKFEEFVKSKFPQLPEGIAP